ncbi:hypothetical protein, partial [Hafnia sp. HMSC23F03]|uniref:hypothetical protein n=1 Tax=Hafnia sp. HMSC23F03 TaxID=1581059 RepID=UPI001AEFEDE7
GGTLHSSNIGDRNISPQPHKRLASGIFHHAYILVLNQSENAISVAFAGGFIETHLLTDEQNN